VINKPLGLSPRHIEFKRAHLYDINPVGVGSMLIASLLSILAHFGLFGALAQAAPPFVALSTALVMAPLLAWLTQGKYYIARTSDVQLIHPVAPATHAVCGLCSNPFETADMAFCPAYSTPICSLCCSLDARCGDRCKPHARLVTQFEGVLRWLLPNTMMPRLHTRLAHYLGLLLALVLMLAGALALIYVQAAQGLPHSETLYQAFFKAFLTLSVLAAVLAWWVVLTRESRGVAQEESDRQTLLLMQEIDAHSLTDQALQQAKEASEAANAAKSRYVTGLSHELRTPLNSILGFTQILQRDSAMPEQHQDALATILRSGSHLVSLIDGLLDVAKIEAGKLRLELTEIPFPELLHDLEQMFTPQAHDKGLRFRLDCVGKIPAVVRGDEKRVRQILINLLSNAVKYTQAGGATLTVRYRSQTATIEVRDTGIGIAAEDMERIFEPFERGSGAEATREPGIGLGLAITRVLTRILGGDLTVTSAPGQGSCFRLQMLLPEPIAAPAGAPSYARVIGYRGSRRTILVIDDNPAQVTIVNRLLRPLDFAVFEATGGAEGLTLARHCAPDLVLLDIQMPGRSGWEVAVELRALLGRAVRIVMVSANAHEFRNGRDERGPHDAFLTKPVDLDALLDAVARQLDLDWILADPNSDAPEQREPIVPPRPRRGLPAAAMPYVEDIRRFMKLGHVRAIESVLNSLEADVPDSSALVIELRRMLHGFDLRALARTLDDAV